MTSQQRALFGWIVGIVGTIGLIFGLSMLGSGPSASTIADILAVNDADHVRGPADAKATLVEYSDFQCPACGYYYPIIKGVEQAAGDSVRIVYRNFPLRTIHPYAQIAAQAAEAAGLQDKYWEMHDLLFERQSTWPTAADVKATLIGYAGELKLDIEKFTSDLDSQSVKDRVERDVDSGTRIRIQGTPTFYLNATQVTTPFYTQTSADSQQDVITKSIQALVDKITAIK